MSEWKIGMSSWIIQDGNYFDFRCQDRINFALEFYPHQCKPSSSSKKQAIYLRENRYLVNAEVVFVAERCFVLDFGILAYGQAVPPSSIQMGSWVEAEIYLGVDPFFYFEDLGNLSGMPPLIYRWQINKIGIETAPHIESVDASGARMMIRDESKLAFREIRQTDAWKDDNGNADYLFDCTLMNDPPKQKLSVVQV